MDNLEIFTTPPPRNIPNTLQQSYLRLTRPRGYWIVFIASLILWIIGISIIVGNHYLITKLIKILERQNPTDFTVMEGKVVSCQKVSPYEPTIFWYPLSPYSQEEIYACQIELNKPNSPQESNIFITYTTSKLKELDLVKVESIKEAPYLIRIQGMPSFFYQRSRIPWEMVIILWGGGIAVLIPYILYWVQRGPRLLKEGELVSATVQIIKPIQNGKETDSWTEIDIRYQYKGQEICSVCRVYGSPEMLQNKGISLGSQIEALVLPGKTSYCFLPKLLQ